MGGLFALGQREGKTVSHVASNRFNELFVRGPFEEDHVDGPKIQRDCRRKAVYTVYNDESSLLHK